MADVNGDGDQVVRLPDDQPHPNGEDRYAIYEVRNVGGAVLRKRVAETASAFVISTIETLLDENQIEVGARVGVFDREKRTWTINPFA